MRRDILEVIDRLLYTYPRNKDVLRVCRELERLLMAGTEPLPNTKPRSLQPSFARWRHKATKRRVAKRKRRS